VSLAAITWAARQHCARPETKLVLIALALYVNDRKLKASGEALAWPSHAALAEFTGLHRKGIIRELKSLSYAQLIRDSGDRRGQTCRVKVWRLETGQEALALRRNSVRMRTIKKESNSPSMRDNLKAGNSPSREIVPLQAGNSPSTGTRNREEPSLKADAFKQAAPEKFDSPDGVPEQVWGDFLTSRNRRKARMTSTAYKRIVGNLNTLAEHGYLPGDMVALAIEHGWLTVKLGWVQNVERTNRTGQQSADGLSNTARAAIQVFGR